MHIARYKEALGRAFIVEYAVNVFIYKEQVSVSFQGESLLHTWLPNYFVPNIFLRFFSM